MFLISKDLHKINNNLKWSLDHHEFISSINYSLLNDQVIQGTDAEYL